VTLKLVLTSTYQKKEITIKWKSNFFNIMYSTILCVNFAFVIYITNYGK